MYLNLFICYHIFSITFGALALNESLVEESTKGDLLKAEEQPPRVVREKFEDEKKLIANTDVIQLNVGGELIMTTRSTLTRINSSTLAIMFNGRWEDKLSRDQNGNIFFDFNPILFQHLLEQLRLIENEGLITLYPPSSSSLVIPFEKMLRKLGIKQSKRSNDIIELNVGGEVLLTRQKTFSQISNLTTNQFVDSDPKLFRQMVNQLRGEHEIEIVTVTTEENVPFNTTLTPDPTITSYKDGICANASWNPIAITVAGGHGKGSGLHQLNHPMGLFIDAYSSIYVADTFNHRIIKWIPGAFYGETVVDYNNTKNYVPSVVVDKNETIYLCDRHSFRIDQWFKNIKTGKTILTNTSCWGLALDKEGSLYISDHEKHSILKWPSKEIVAGGHGDGNDDDQLSSPHKLFVDDQQTIYIADYFNHRIMKWFTNLKEGLVVAGGNGYGEGLNQLRVPHSIVVDQMGTMYIVDFGNNRIIRWFKHSAIGSIIIGNNGSGNGTNQLSDPYDIALDRQGNLYVADTSNHRIQKFLIDKSSCTTTLNSNES